MAKSCDPGCTCGRHRGGVKLTAAEIRERNTVRMRERRKLLPRENAEIVARYRAAHPEEVRLRNKQGGKKWRDQYLYGLSPERRAEMLAEQEGNCYLCSEPLDLAESRKIHVDHDHSCCRGVRSCGKCIRGLACEPCNKGIGAFGDDPERMRRAADRLEAAKGNMAARLSGASRPELPPNVRRMGRREESA
jgi:ribosomal protein L15E